MKAARNRMTVNRELSRCDLMRGLLCRKGELEIRVSGRSMLPSLQSGDVVRLAPFDGRLCAGDLVVYPGRRSRNPVLHRVVKADGGNVCLMGDNATVFTDIQRADIVGMARSVFLDGEWHSASVAVEQGLLIAELSDSIREASLGKRIDEVERLQRKRRAECQKWRDCVCARTY